MRVASNSAQQSKDAKIKVPVTLTCVASFFAQKTKNAKSKVPVTLTGWRPIRLAQFHLEELV